MSDDTAAVARLRKAVVDSPRDAVAWHNLAAAEGDSGRAAEAEAAARRALSLGIRAAETRLVLARALQAQHRLGEAQRAFEDALAVRPGYPEAHRDLAQLVWMHTGNAAAALQRVDAALRADPGQTGLHLVRSIVLEFAGDEAAAWQAAQAGLGIAPTDIALLRQAAHLGVGTGQVELALDLARRAIAAAPGSPDVQLTLCEALLASGRHADAEPIARALHTQAPQNQHTIAILALAWRLAGDPRYRTLFDYAGLVEARFVDGAERSPEFLAEVAHDLHSLHRYEAHPLQQSVRGGSQITLAHAERARPPIARLMGAIERATSAYLQRLGPGSDPMRSRNTGRSRVSGAWSVRLRSGGHHTDHVHQKGWLSAVCYLAVPPSIGAGQGPSDRAGWLRLGHPGIVTSPALSAEGFVRPEPGLVVFFPAYMWHGVEPFEDAAPRLSVAMDIVPA